MSQRIIQLMRTNLALALLCVISIGVLIILARTPERGGGTESDVTKPLSVAQDALTEALAHSPLKDMPTPSAFRSFIYAAGDILDIQGDCSDTYRVTLIYPGAIDYRIDPLSVRYNVATICDKQGPYSEKLPLDSAHLVVGQTYYVITANEGEQGIWHDPR